MKRKGPALSFASAPVPKNKGEKNNQNLRAKPAYSQDSMTQGVVSLLHAPSVEGTTEVLVLRDLQVVSSMVIMVI